MTGDWLTQLIEDVEEEFELDFILEQDSSPDTPLLVLVDGTIA